MEGKLFGGLNPFAADALCLSRGYIGSMTTTTQCKATIDVAELNRSSES